MLIPQNGRIVIIDDHIEQAYPLIRALSKHKHPFTYHTEELEQMPNTPYVDVRLIFLDINLTDGVNDAAISSQLKTTLEKLISPGTPYIAAIWSINENAHADLLADLFENKIPKLKPLSQISLAKSELFSLDVDTGKYIEDPAINIIDVISEKLNTEINKINSFKALAIWEKIILECSIETIHQFSNIIEKNEYWHKNLKHLFYKMAHAQMGRTIIEASEKEILQAALRTLTSSFEGKILSKINDPASMAEDIDLKNQGPIYTANVDGTKVEIKWVEVKKWTAYFNGTQKAENSTVPKLKSTPEDNIILDNFRTEYLKTSPKLNAELLISNAKSPVLYPGNVYEVKRTNSQKRTFIGTYFSQVLKKTTTADPVFVIPDEKFNMLKLVEMECTPLCDFSQKKRLRTRMLPGLLYNIKFKGQLNQSDTFYLELPPFEYENEIYQLVFDYRLFKSHNIEKSDLHPSDFLFKLKNEVVTDILARISSHVNRPGITTIN